MTPEAAATHAQTREDVLEVARLLCSAASLAQAAGEAELAERLVERAGDCLEALP
jgi:hypothetical protein